MTNLFYKISSSIALIGLTASMAAQAQEAREPAFAVAQASDTTLGCTGLAMEMVKTANFVAANATTSMPAAPSTAAAPAQMENAQVNGLAQAINQAQLNNQLGALQVQAARAGINPGTSGAAIGGLALLVGAASSPGGAAEGAKQAAASFASQKLASSVPGGALVGSLVGGLFGKKKKAIAPITAPPAATGPAPSQLVQLGQQRMAFLQSLSASKSCK